jgi:predicted DNA-binding transcriptional regulator AlpA
MVKVKPDSTWVTEEDIEGTLQVADIVSLTEAAKKLGIGRAYLYQLSKDREESGFPLPIYTSSTGKNSVYHYPTVYDFWSKWGKLRKKHGGRPPVKEYKPSSVRMIAHRARKSDSCRIKVCPRKGRPALSGYCPDCWYDKSIHEEIS